ncbi:predicted protein [Sparassis crispa]|uniref:Impact N-terminal domain-containing protein n=1 Tax=Sparassis crispa TaxID=139825 RepID=A0A401GAZ6_9APHY|nr:predicted protein [Sparassis crispa]GBE79344.1 predicted protein [Sparassis crispa]
MTAARNIAATSSLIHLTPSGNPPTSVQHRWHSSRPSSSESVSWPHAVASSETLTHLKSAFRAHASRLPSTYGDTGDTPSETGYVHEFIAHVEKTFPRTKRATHAMWAWRGSSPSKRTTGTADGSRAASVSSGSSDGGESGAGERLSRLLELSGCEDVVLVVFRWYGGVKLGSDRWKCISSVAKEALELGGFGLWGKTEDANNEQRSKGKGKKGKREKK